MNIWAFIIGWILTGIFICILVNNFEWILFSIILCILVSTLLFLTGLGHF